MSGQFRFEPQPDGVPWPHENWPIAENPADLGIDESAVRSAVGDLFSHGVQPPDGRGVSLALVAVHRGRIVFEQYGRLPASAFHGEQPISESTSLISWSMAKSITHALVGLLVEDGVVDPSERVQIPEWDSDSRRNITWADLLRMRDGLDFVEDYVVDSTGATRSDVIEMLFGSGADDVFAYARSRSPANEPGSTWSYSSGTTNIVCGLVGQLIGGRQEVERCLKERIFEPLGMSSASARFDTAGTFIGSSYVYATARDFARFGYLYLRGGLLGDRRVLSSEWVDRARRQHALDPDNGHGYGEHWWTWNGDQKTFAALGYEGQRTIVVPDRDLVLVHLGKWDVETQPYLDSVLTRLIAAVPRIRPDDTGVDRP